MSERKTIIDFALFQAFFPQLLIGPICRSVDLLPQIHAAPLKRFPQFNKAGWLIVSGLFKKIFVATLLFENGSLDVFSSPENYSAIGLWGGMFGYSIQLYCDFSGYTDLARDLLYCWDSTSQKTLDSPTLQVTWEISGNDGTSPFRSGYETTFIFHSVVQNARQIESRSIYSLRF